MENCLVTKLKATVNNDLLCKPSELILSVEDIQGYKLGFPLDDNVSVSVISGNVTVTPSTTSSIRNYEITGTGKVSVMTNYKVTQIYVSIPSGVYSKTPILVHGIDTFFYNDLLAYSATNMIFDKDVDIANFNKFTNLRVLNLNKNFKDTSIIGEIDSIESRISSLNALDFYNNGNLGGSFKVLALRNNSVNIIGTKISGSIESYVARKRKLGSTTGSVSWAWLGGSNITFDGRRFGNDGSTTISWTADTITLTYGNPAVTKTIDNSDVED